ncbi:peptide-methionine (S)-S-oxide reductase [Candidatus Adlerbacteria bacterium RIFCSPHIGHO2_02_FULL_54_18]|uniref:Peptide methionine sulfoxide reductase MsrA n=2 Tax=Candidatus Adleribacteriota TaxID=1752736 RepID=A0A1F4Y242_9BACT|nr:MAG: peptide-methionine (S)-S-oxide reductase [Candidatus Adlerbacteria bacterium RIFCSPLOWO2_01_FULL_54_21b]OGC87971.1 MAG: peptide-methionine (S)-S-oxide reductase [Candidatus Adlerbacteria bacterium RIFCSPHIGHO2_02_FULL_54_18]
METIVFGGGCFWCTEAVFLMLKGVESAEPGYAGPAYKTDKGPSYEEVSTGATPYVESAKVVYNPDSISFPELLQVYFGSHNPTELNRQGSDVGPQYRSAVFYTTLRQKEMAEHYIKVLGQGSPAPIVTTIEPLEYFYKAEDYHKKYYENHQSAGYCQIIIAPKVEKVQKKFKNLIK